MQEGSTPGSGRYPGVGNGNPLQYSCLENPWTEESGRLQSMRSQVLDRTEQLQTHTLLPPGPCSSEAPVSLLERESPESRDHMGYEHRT